MDFWDVAKLMWRRWYVTLPALLLTLAGALWTGFNVNPDYKVTGHVALVGPAIQRTESDSEVTRINPWSGEALADAATIRLQGKALADTLKAEGYSGEWSALVSGRLPVIRLEVVAARPEHAQATLQRLREVIAQEVRDRQAEYNVPREEQVTTVDYDGGETVEPVTGKVKRALIVVVGAGLILTTGLVVAFDAVVRRRRARAATGAHGTQPEAGSGEARGRYQYTPAAGSAAVPVAGPPANGTHPGQVARSAHPVQVRYADQGHHRDHRADYGPDDQPLAWPASPAPSAPPRSPDDSTVVLPLSNVNVSRQEGGRPEPSAEVRKH